MPFLAHFNLVERPFALTPNSQLYFPSDSHQQVLTPLSYAIERGEGIIKVSGEVGTGKTLMCRILTGELVKTKAVAYILNPQNDPDWIVTAVCREFGLDPEHSRDPFHLLNDFLLEQYQKQRPAVLVVDEAQALGLEGLEAVRRLSNLETKTAKLLQIVLFGQPELDRLLRSHALRQLNQRIVFSFTIQPLSEETMIDYIRYRVILSSGNLVNAHQAIISSGSLAAAQKLFDGEALRRIARVSKGVPRLANIIADKSLLAAFSADAQQVTRRHVEEAIADSSHLLPRWDRLGALSAAGPAIAAGLVIGIVGLWAFVDAASDGWSLSGALAGLLGGSG